MEAMQPTRELYEELQQAYDFFNRELFSDLLPGCLLTLQRKKRTCGYFSRERFVNQDGDKTDEIALNPAYFSVFSLQESMSFLVHEMVHQYQSVTGQPGRKRYHNEEFAWMMERIGLIASDTGYPGGRRTGESMSHYIEEGGLFEQACVRLPDGFRLSWMDRFPPSSHVLRLVNQARAERIDEADEEGDDDEGVEEPTTLTEAPLRQEPGEEEGMMRMAMEESEEEADDESAWRLFETFGLDDQNSFWDGLADGPDDEPPAEPVGDTAPQGPTGEEKGPLESAQDKLKRLLSLGVVVNPSPVVTNPSNRVKYSCPLCGVNVWGKPRLNLVCGDCSESFEVV